jgi:hypothetical protein
MRVSLFLTVVAVLCFAGGSRADKIGSPQSYKVVSADGKFVFVMLTLQPAEEELKVAEGNKSEIKTIRDTYKKSGLYKNDGSTEPLWTVDWYSREAAVASDGVHVVRFAGPHTYEERLNPDRTKRVLTENDLKKEALSIFAKGKLVREFSIADLVDDMKSLRKTVTFFRWMKQSKIDDDKGQLEVVTLEGNRIRIDLATAKIVEKKKAE